MGNFRFVLYAIILGGIFVFYQRAVQENAAPGFVQNVQAAPVIHESGNEIKVGADAPLSTDIPLEEPIELDYKSREEIFSIRTMNVNLHAILLEKDYHPSSNVFGQIVSNKPWWGIEGEFCEGPGSNSIDGPAEETRFFINPYLLLGLDEGKAFPMHGVPCDPAFPRPLSLKWVAGESRAEAVYDISRFFRERLRYPKEDGASDILELVNYNARDFGFEYIRVNRAQSQNVEPVSDSKMFQDVMPMKGFIHLGGSCGYPGGCNNASPYEPDLKFRITDLPAVLACDLWREKPADSAQKPDFTFILYLN
ncbi:MAG: hypothetical protein WCI27_00215 [Candidatus Omnitrophota bacterium]